MSKPPVLFFVFIPLLFITDGYADTYKLRSPIGTNLDFVSMWSPELPFVDVMKSSSLWISADSAKRDTQWDNQQKIDIDENGWVRTLAPGQIVRSLTRRETGQPYPGGQYLVRYKGNGDLKFMFDAREISRKPGEIVLQVTPSEAGIGMIIEATDPGNHLRDIEITMPKKLLKSTAAASTASRAFWRITALAAASGDPSKHSSNWAITSLSSVSR